MQRPVRPEDDVVTAFRDGQVTLRSLRRSDGYTFSDKEIGYQGIRTGDLVIHQMDAFAGAIGVSEADGKSTPVYTVLQPAKACDVDNRFYMYLLRHLAQSDYILSLAKGIRERSTDFRWAELAELELPIPPLVVQRKIVCHLDSETAHIDALIDRKQRFIDLLLDKRTALITQAVTKGLDPNAKMVDSGIEWIGSVPAHWRVGRLKDLAPFVTSGSRGWAQYYADDGPMFLRITNLPRGGSVDLLMEDLRYVDVPAGAEGARTQVQEGDILISITAEMGAVAVVPCGLGEAYVSQHVALTRPQRSVDSRWLAYVMASNVGCQHYENRLYGGTKIQLSLDDVRETPIPIPPIAECMAIKEHLDRETIRLGVLVDKTSNSIDLLREYRTALISAAVTGQIDIPGTETTEEVA